MSQINFRFKTTLGTHRSVQWECPVGPVVFHLFFGHRTFSTERCGSVVSGEFRWEFFFLKQTHRTPQGIFYGEVQWFFVFFFRHGTFPPFGKVGAQGRGSNNVTLTLSISPHPPTFHNVISLKSLIIDVNQNQPSVCLHATSLPPLPSAFGAFAPQHMTVRDNCKLGHLS